MPIVNNRLVGIPGADAAPASMYSCSAVQLQAVASLVKGDASIATAICATVDVGALGPMSAVVQWLVEQAQTATQARQEVAWGVDTGFLFICAILVRGDPRGVLP
jgi:hypothetical protein